MHVRVLTVADYVSWLRDEAKKGRRFVLLYGLESLMASGYSRELEEQGLVVNAHTGHTCITW